VFGVQATSEQGGGRSSTAEDIRGAGTARGLFVMLQVATSPAKPACVINPAHPAHPANPTKPTNRTNPTNPTLPTCRFIRDDEIVTSSGDSTCILWDVEVRTQLIAQHNITQHWGRIAQHSVMQHSITQHSTTQHRIT
jgi:hypothetical protein